MRVGLQFALVGLALFLTEITGPSVQQEGLLVEFATSAEAVLALEAYALEPFTVQECKLTVDFVTSLSSGDVDEEEVKPLLHRRQLRELHRLRRS